MLRGVSYSFHLTVCDSYYICLCLACVYTCFLCVCIPVYQCRFTHVSVRDVMLFTQVAVSDSAITQHCSQFVVDLPLSPFLVNYSYPLCSSVFHGNKDGPYCMCSHPNTLYHLQLWLLAE